MSIFIIGVPSTGKSSLAKNIKEWCPTVNVFSFEAIRNGFIKSMPDLQMNDRNSKAREDILPEFIVEFASWNERLTGDLSVIEGSFASAGKVLSLASDNDLIICLGYGGDKDKNMIAQIALSRVDSKHYLFGCSVEKFVKHFYDIDTMDWENFEFCKRHQIPYFDTSCGWKEAEDFVKNWLRSSEIIVKK